MRSPIEIVADAAHEFSDSLPKTSQDRALLFSRRYGFAEAALKALQAEGYGIIRKETLDVLFAEANSDASAPRT